MHSPTYQKVGKGWLVSLVKSSHMRRLLDEGKREGREKREAWRMVRSSVGTLHVMRQSEAHGKRFLVSWRSLSHVNYHFAVLLFPPWECSEPARRRYSRFHLSRERKDLVRRGRRIPSIDPSSRRVYNTIPVRTVWALQV